VHPFDFGRRYTPREQLVVLAHEATHIQRHDPWPMRRGRAGPCVNWFNPAVTCSRAYLRIDQELACDAQVVAAHPTARRSYAEAMLKTQLAAAPLPLGCYWPAQSAAPLGRADPALARRRRRLAAGAPASRPWRCSALPRPGLAWAVRPPQIVEVPRPPPGPKTTSTAVAEARVVRPVEIIAEHRRTSRRAAPMPAPAPSVVGDALTPPPGPVWLPSSRPLSPSASDAPPRSGRGTFACRSPVGRRAGFGGAGAGDHDRPDGRRLTTDLTAFGSQSVYRTGWFRAERQPLCASSPASSRTAIASGSRASLDRRFQAATSGTIAWARGETGDIVLGNGQVVTVTPTVRPETAEEVEAGKRALRNMSPISDKPLRSRTWSRPGAELPI
jgi:hypothetical protein